MSRIVGLMCAGLVVAVALLAPPVVSAQSFPQDIVGPEGTITVYQPQPEKLQGNVLTGRAAMSLVGTGKTSPVFGAFWFTARVDNDGDGEVTLSDVKVTRVRWPDSKPEDEATFTAMVEKAAANTALTISVERLSASLATAEREQQSLDDLKHDPPKVIFATTLSMLLLYDGAPQWSDVENSSYQRVMNTPYLVVRHKPTGACYFGNGSIWYSARDPLGPWTPTAAPPADLLQMLPKPEDEEEAPPSPDAPPAVVTATEATELIVTDGPPKWKPVGAGELLFVQNTETPWLREVAANQMWILLSGRWYRSASESGPWTFVRPDQLPASFSRIPAGSDIGGVRTSIAGTEEAEDATLDAVIPQTTAVNRKEATLEVLYQGEPAFQKIPGTNVSLAGNTATQVLEIGGRYYAVDNGVWFTAPGPKGPWAVADSVPEDEIQKIPASSSAYNVTHVHVYQSTPEVVYVGYTPGYLWSFPYHGVPVYGTGWYYPPYPGFYYPRPVTFGFHVGYNPWTGWNFGMSWNVGFMHFGVRWGGGWGPYYRPGLGCCRGWYGGYRPGWGYRGRTNINVGRININNSINVGNRARIERNLRNNPRTGVARDNIYRRPENLRRNASPALTRPQTRPARPATGRRNDVLADRDGNVVRPTSRGVQQRSQGKWQNPSRPTPTTRPVDRSAIQRDAAARARGVNRERSRQSVQRRPAPGGARRGGVPRGRR